MLYKIANTIKNLKFVICHPLNKNKSIAAIGRFIWWQVRSRLITGDVMLPFVDEAVLTTRAGMAGATGNIYVGLHEFEDMAFLLHLLRPSDLFVDVGANIGSFTVLASAVAEARSISIEPVQGAFNVLRKNIINNKLEDRVTALNIGIGSETGTLRFTSELDTVNHVICESDDVSTAVEVEVCRLDELLENYEPVLIKIDVEGFETNVVMGARNVLTRPSLLAVIMETNGSGARYGFDENILNENMKSFGFSPCVYMPNSRQVVSLDGCVNKNGNTIYIKNISEVRARVNSSKYYNIKNVSKKI